MSEETKPRLVGINHVAIEVGDIDAALEFYGKLFGFTLRGRNERSVHRYRRSVHQYDPATVTRSDGG
jgi:catechol 2,3-dioxygenase-like lactoylglutathione lyase family enzyme